MTLEAALVLPLFLFCMINILFLFQMIGAQSHMTAAAHMTGNDIVKSASLKNVVNAGGVGTVLSAAYIPFGISQHLAGSLDDSGAVKGGLSGLDYTDCRVLLSNDIVDLRVRWKAVPYVSAYGLGYSKNMSVRYYSRGFTGFDAAGTDRDSGSDEPYVYITPNGTVYHLSRGCPYLSPSVRSVEASALSSLRNESGGKYYPCSACGASSGGSSVYYITDYGTKYHKSASCSALKRDVRCVPLSQAGGRGRCSKCGG
ncbi:MAG: pilus assembly protein [Lachnospiraceae bacterium]|nr:pilus assembly protein [Lachnospiraceae bacterium]